jgi:MtN3 and saliva related transmembrane protein
MAQAISQIGEVYMQYQELLGLLAGALTTMGFMPQVWRLYKLKSAREISLTFNLLFLIGAATWISYGVVLQLLPVIFWNIIVFLLAAAMLVAKIKYGQVTVK